MEGAKHKPGVWSLAIENNQQPKAKDRKFHPKTPKELDSSNHLNELGRDIYIYIFFL